MKKNQHGKMSAKTAIMAPIRQEKAEENTHTAHPDAQWFPKAGLGLFIHWGISTVDNDPRFSHEISWCMMKNRLEKDEPVILPERYYTEFARDFQPACFEPDKWLSAAAEAGFRYAVFTTRHHDGFAMWPSAYGDLNTKNYQSGRDFVKPFIEACRKYGLKAGLYYSPMDWYFFREYNTWDHNFCWDPYESWLRKDVPHGLVEAHKEYCSNQVRELLTNYGKIDLLWLDGGYGELSEEYIRSLQPGIVINSRLGGGQPGDYKTPERSMPEESLKGWWELCEIWNKGPWSWTPAGEEYKPLHEITEMLVKVRTMGGNLLVNAAPRADGTLPPECYARFSELREWMEKYGRKYMPDWESKKQ